MPTQPRINHRPAYKLSCPPARPRAARRRRQRGAGTERRRVCTRPGAHPSVYQGLRCARAGCGARANQQAPPPSARRAASCRAPVVQWPALPSFPPTLATGPSSRCVLPYPLATRRLPRPQGYSEVTLAGDSITDTMLASLAAANGHNLVAVTLSGAGSVTDAGLSALFSATPHLQQLRVTDLGPGVTGSFLPQLLGSCRRLAGLHINGAPGLDWAVMDWARATPRAAEPPAGLAAAGQLCAHAGGTQAPAATESGAAGRAEGGIDGEEAAAEEPWPASLGGVAAPSSSARGPALSPPPSPMQSQHSSLSAAAAAEGDSHAFDRAAPRGRTAGGGAAAAAAVAAELAQQLSEASLEEAAGASSRSIGISAAAARQPEQQQPVPPARPPPLRSLAKLHVRGVRHGGLPQLLALAPGLSDLELDGPAVNIQFAAVTW
jgi:hypothetical protein